MNFTIKKDGHVVNEYQFAKGPIHIGRSNDNEICLPEMGVSRRHTIILFENDRWFVQDLRSTNKTFLNEQEINKAELKNGDVLRIGDFTIEAEIAPDTATKIEDTSDGDETLIMDAALSTPRDEVVIRKPDGAHAPAVRLTAKRLTDFSQATDSIAKANNLEEIMETLIDTAMRQFTAYRIWCGVRSQGNGPLTYIVGKRRDGTSVELSELSLSDRVTEALEKKRSLVLPRVAAQFEDKDRIRSAMIAPITRLTTCYGIIYVDNAIIHDHYNLGDLDYLILLAIYTGVKVTDYL